MLVANLLGFLLLFFTALLQECSRSLAIDLLEVASSILASSQSSPLGCSGKPQLSSHGNECKMNALKTLAAVNCDMMEILGNPWEFYGISG